MRQRRMTGSENPETLATEEPEGGDRFFACYLLRSRCPRYKGHTYIGFTVNPRRRIRQHNGEIGRGASRTKKKRPWEMALCIYGFPTNTSALQFEWAWQNPYVSKAVRKAATNFKTLGGFANKIKLAYTMLTLPPWQSLNLTVNFFSTEYTKHAAGCLCLPKQMKVKICPMDELPSCISDDVSDNEDDWYKEKECDEATNSGTLEEETLADSVVLNSTDEHQQNGSGNRVNEDDWYKEKECDEATNSGTLEEETLADSVVLNSTDEHQQNGSGNRVNEEVRQYEWYNGMNEVYVGNDEVRQDEWYSGIEELNVGNEEVQEDERYRGREFGEAMNSGLSLEITLSDLGHNSAEGQEIDTDKTSSRGFGNNKDVEEDATTKFAFFTSPVRMPSSNVTPLYTTEASKNEDTVELGGSTMETFPIILVADDEQSPGNSYLRPCDSEVVDLITPSPLCRNSLCGKKSRVAISYPQIIDLTKSPNFIQL